MLLTVAVRKVTTKLRNYFQPQGDRHASRLRRRRKLVGYLWSSLPTVILVLLIVGYAWLLAIASPMLGQRTYIDENALQPGQVNMNWNWADVQRADEYLAELERLRDLNATSEEIAEFVKTEFEKQGIPASTQHYTFHTLAGLKEGSNAYGIFHSPRASGSEAMLISASWLSRTGEGDGTLNLRGVSTVLSLAAFLKGYSLWAKDLIFVISDGYLDGMRAWVTAYHGTSQENLQAEPLDLSSGVIWTALNIDYPGHSFSHLGVFFEGLNGRLPNQDLFNSFQLISRYSGGVPVVLYDHLDTREDNARKDGCSFLPDWFSSFLKQSPALNEYCYRMRNILRHMGYQARGRASGVHGLMHQYRIDAITLFAVPAPGPHGFHSLGRIIESTLRTMNNLLERLHASFFFYLLVGTTMFLKVGLYLPSAVLISAAMLFAGLREWVNAGSILTEEFFGVVEEKGTVEVPPKRGHRSSRRRPVLRALTVMIATHALGVALFCCINSRWFLINQNVYSVLLLCVIFGLSSTCLLFTKPPSSEVAPLICLLKSLNLCLASTVTSVISVLNFSLAATLAATLGLPLCYSSSSPDWRIRILKYAFHVLLALGWLLVMHDEVRRAIIDWELLRVWFAPFVCVVYVPLMLQAAIVCLLPQDAS
ncbi:Gaa1-domain-containing protein [Laetiporus sulphureus 93-53]|uniref:Gaa1-domain-containing protein n=1 Tax=Laetiporus sulphureus 93-53 TaxID=1314785 RepID=A0A165H6X6_9APHY|nr:Gaa1-domain-containing protein [Laetiporus sulphureus 93-53]KZT11326.1 Gaa1-domain-containing protein [Laetiporus sulphureus 93-53]